MATPSFAQVPPTSATMALNAYIFGYGGHSLVTPHMALKQLWWTDERIKAKVTRSFVVSKLRGEEREFLDRPLAFGEGLTDDTYMEWILNRANRLFMILSEIGVPDQIFGCIDDTWTDDDLPVALEDIPSLELAYTNDEALNKKFYNTQFLYLHRELQSGAHFDYGPKEHIPMEHANSIPPAVNLQIWDRIHFPSKPDEIYMRRKLSLVEKETGLDHRESFMRDITKAQKFSHEHIAPVWATYTAQNAGYIVSDFVGEHTVATFIDHRTPTQFQRLPAHERPLLLCEWMHCLSDALASLHCRGVAHTAIRPSNILITRTNRIAFADLGSIGTFQRGKKVSKVEIYDYAAPESQWSSPAIFASSPPLSSTAAFHKLRQLSSESNSSSGSSSTGDSSRNNSLTDMAPLTSPISNSRTDNVTNVANPVSSVHNSTGHVRNFSRRLAYQTLATNSELSSTTHHKSHGFLNRSLPNARDLSDLPIASPQMSDIYSLACVFLDIVTFMIKGKTTDFVKFRTTRCNAASLNNKRGRNDTSFHSHQEKIDAWMMMLKEDSDQRPEQIFQAVPELLRLIRKMIAQNAALRPSAMEVRDRIEAILVDIGGVKKLCCAGRQWNMLSRSKASTWSSLESKQDPMSIATGITSLALSKITTDAQRHGNVDRNIGGALLKIEAGRASLLSRKGSVLSSKISSWRKAAFA